MKLTMILRCAPDSAACDTAAAVLASWQAAGHEVGLLFLHAAATALTLEPERPGTAQLRSLISAGTFPTIACVGSAAKVGACDQKGTPSGNWLGNVRPGSLGELAVATAASDRVVSIG